MADTDRCTIGVDGLPAKRVKGLSEPRVFVTWNCNGFVSRCKWNQDGLRQLLHETNDPDVICIQEVRLKALSPSTRNTPKDEELKIVRGVLQGIFHDYKAFWSLADTRYAGTLTLIHKRIAFDGQTAFTVDGAIDILLKCHGKTRKDVGLTELPNEQKKPKQTTMKEFFAAKPKNKGTSSTTQSSSTSASQEHHPEGRFQFFSFHNMNFIQTYVPNNGTKQESFDRRKQWDDQMLTLFKVRSKLSSVATPKPLLWCGDMNCAAEYRDGTHWEQRQDGTVYEWWCDESTCFASSKQHLAPDRDADDRGIPSFTPAERRRFQKILQAADLVDTWRHFHPQGCAGESNLSRWEKPEWTWRGHLSKEGNNFQSKYHGKGQRLDYFLLSNSMVEAVEECEILGYGANRDGLFCGSDHCASKLILKAT